MCVSLFNITDDILSACYKLARYYMREFTEISLFSKDDKVPLPKLYVAMKWKRYTKDKKQRPGQAHRRREFQLEPEEKESILADYNEIFQKVTFFGRK